MTATGATSRYFHRSVNVPMSRRERLRASLPFARKPAAIPVSDDLLTLLLDVLRAEPIAGRDFDDLRFLVHQEGTHDDPRRRAHAFLFDRGSDTPFAMVKAQTDLSSGSLQEEARALTGARALATGPLLATIPEVLRIHADDVGEVLAMSALPGRSAWFDMHASLFPSLRIRAHFAAAAQWLGDFHHATRHDDDTTAVHGDFWAHNVLSEPGSARVGVIDWENFSAKASRYLDLFQYPLTYGLAFPWKRYRKLAQDAAFAKTFLAENRLSSAVRAYFASYCRRTGLPPARLRPAFRAYLESHGTMHERVHSHMALRDMPWDLFLAQLDAADASIFP